MSKPEMARNTWLSRHPLIAYAVNAAIIIGVGYAVIRGLSDEFRPLLTFLGL